MLARTGLNQVLICLKSSGRVLAPELLKYTLGRHHRPAAPTRSHKHMDKLRCLPLCDMSIFQNGDSLCWLRLGWLNQVCVYLRLEKF